MNFVRVLFGITLAGCVTPAEPLVGPRPREDASLPRDAASSPDRDPPDPDPILCGGGYTDPCAADKYCAYTQGCGSAGNCRSKVCKPEGDAICGCDGVTYESKCAAAQLGVAVSHAGACADASQQFRCGEFTCDTGFYCLDQADRAEPGEQRFYCIALPAGCTGCTCGEDLDLGCWVGSTCIKDANHVTVRCK